jgi:hypothetical protein
VDPEAGTATLRTYADSLNPPILHRKELLLAADHPRRAEFAALTEACESIGLFDEPTRIGHRRQWLDLVREKGYRIEGHALVPLGNAEADGEAGDEPQDAVLFGHWQAARQLTALVRYAFSAPVQSLARSGKVSLMRYDGFDALALPRMIERVKVKLRQQDIDWFSYGERAGFAPPYLFYKSRYLNEEFTEYPEQLAFDEALDALGLCDLSGYGPDPQTFDQALAARRWEVEGLRLVRSRSIPDLDAPCGRFLTYRQHIECGETHAREGLPNLPKEPDSYSALLDLAVQVLDPVIDWFGMIRLTYGFCSPELAREIPGRIDPKLDQHAAHERNRRGKPICERLGAAVDFIVDDEDMLEVARWMAANTPFDRLYFYGPDLPIHVSHGPDHSRQIVEMHPTSAGRLVPRVVLNLG